MPITNEQIILAQSFQHEAAHDNRQRVRLIAGPGTGKSFAIGERVRWLLHQNVPPDNIFSVSFTNAASANLKEMIDKYCSKHNQAGYDKISVSTLHSLGLRTLRRSGMLQYPVDPIVLDDFEVKEILDKEFSSIIGTPPGRCELIRKDFEAFSSTGHYEPVNYIPPDTPISNSERDDYKNYHYPRTILYSCVLPGEIVRQCVDKIYAGTLDPVNLLGISYFVVDEYQDFNPADIEFVNWISDRGVNTFVAGDDDQSIYSFRHATPEGIQTFIDGSSDVTGDHELPYCFRCTPSILDSGQQLINTFPHPARIPKKLQSLYLDSDPVNHGQLYTWKFPDATLEARVISNACSDLINLGIPPSEIMVLLCYPGLQLQVLQPELEALGVKFVSPKQKKYKDLNDGRFVLSMLRLICNKDDYIAYRLILGLLPGVGPKTCNDIASKTLNTTLTYRDIFERNLDDTQISGRSKSAIDRVRQILSSIHEWTPDDTIDEFLPEIVQILIATFGEEEINNFHQVIHNLPDKMNLKEIRDFIWFDDPKVKAELLECVYERLELEIPEEGFIDECIDLLTMHGAKGLDATVVFIPGLENEILPGPRRMEYPGLVLESARMLYVSITRAKALCILSYSEKRVLYGSYQDMTPSIFTSHLGQPFIYRENYEKGFSESELSIIESTIDNI